MLLSECQRNNRRNQTAQHPQKAWSHVVVVADIAVVAAVAAARARL